MTQLITRIDLNLIHQLCKQNHKWRPRR